MRFSECIKQPVFWKHALRLAFSLLLLMTIISLLFNSFSDILKFDLKAVAEKNFNNGKWVTFFATKVIIAFFYSLWMTSRSMK